MYHLFTTPVPPQVRHCIDLLYISRGLLGGAGRPAQALPDAPPTGDLRSPEIPPFVTNQQGSLSLWGPPPNAQTYRFDDSEWESPVECIQMSLF
jgi:hypothetical protein